MKLTNEDVQEILDLLDATKFDVLHLQTERFKLTLRRQPNGDQSTSAWTQESESLATPHILKSSTVSSAATPQATNATAASSAPLDAGDNSGTIPIRASLPGTFYRAPGPGAPPFVEVGSAVQEDTVIGIIETMKLMNAIHAGARGTIAEILAANAHFVEQGSVLMRIKPDPA
jgi:acetyl-CoA carboxylase biotin carboxyl carrier protein